MRPLDLDSLVLVRPENHEAMGHLVLSGPFDQGRRGRAMVPNFFEIVGFSEMLVSSENFRTFAFGKDKDYEFYFKIF